MTKPVVKPGPRSLLRARTSLRATGPLLGSTAELARTGAQAGLAVAFMEPSRPRGGG